MSISTIYKDCCVRICLQNVKGVMPCIIILEKQNLTYNPYESEHVEWDENALISSAKKELLNRVLKSDCLKTIVVKNSRVLISSVEISAETVKMLNPFNFSCKELLEQHANSSSLVPIDENSISTSSFYVFNFDKCLQKSEIEKMLDKLFNKPNLTPIQHVKKLRDVYSFEPEVMKTEVEKTKVKKNKIRATKKITY